MAISSWIYLEASMSDPIPNSQPPFFYFQHNLAPHEPFNVTEDGKFTKNGMADNAENRGVHNFGGDNSYRRGYINKLRFVNTLMLNKIKRILKNDTRSKIIIIHADHGGGLTHSLKADGQSL